MTSLTVVVCSRDRPDQLAASLRALDERLRPEDERIVVDSASVDAAAVAAVAAAAGFRLVRCEQPGLSRARNAGLAAASSELVAFTDDDCRVGDGWTQAIDDAFRDEPGIGFVTGPVLADREARLHVSVDPSTDHRRLVPGSDPTTAGHGANMSFRLAAIRDVGAFDVELGAGARLRAAEDTDAFWRLLAAGWDGVFDPRVVVTHQQWRTTAEALRTSFGYGVGYGAMAARGVRRKQPGAWGVLGRGVWRDGMARAGRQLREGYQTGAASSAVRAVGVVTGALRSRARPA